MVNSVSIGKQDVPQVSTEGVNAYCTVFDAVYQPGKMEAVLYTEGKETGRFELTTASEKLQLSIEDQSENLDNDLKDILHFEISLTDDKGILKPMCDREVTVTVEGAGRIQGFGSAAPLSTERFGDGKFTTYYGKAVLAVRPIGDGEIHIKAQADGCETVEFSI